MWKIYVIDPLKSKHVLCMLLLHCHQCPLYMFVICTVTQEHICSLYNNIIVGRKQSAIYTTGYLRYFILDMSRHTVLVLYNAHSANLLIPVIPLRVPDVFHLSDDIKISPRYHPIKTSLLLSHVKYMRCTPNGIFLYFCFLYMRLRTLPRPRTLRPQVLDPSAPLMGPIFNFFWYLHSTEIK
jgi:hypothetical protein